MTNHSENTKARSDALEIVNLFIAETRLQDIDWVIKSRPDGPYLVMHMAHPAERFYSALANILDKLEEANLFKERALIKKYDKMPESRLAMSETQLLRTTLAESLTVTRHSFEDDFFARYIRSVSGAEEEIVAKNNHVVYGRRGSGKSSLLAYFMHTLKRDNKPYAWVAMQTYEHQDQHRIICSILNEIVQQLKPFLYETSNLAGIINGLEQYSERDGDLKNELDKLIPKIRGLFSKIAETNGAIVIFLDDIHLVGQKLQPLLLSRLYSISRDNKVFLKISGIEQFSKIWDPVRRVGLQSPGDAQLIKLDYNLSMPDKAKKHLHNILNAHAKYCGLPSVDFICNDNVLNRIVWVSAGVPRDALNIFSKGISKASIKGNKKVSVTSINEAASEAAGEKIRDLESQEGGNSKKLKAMFENIMRICISDYRKNAFLIEIRNNDEKFILIKELVALRLLHVLSEGITPSEVNRRFMALMLDYGFYVGLRAARAVEVFQDEPTQLAAKDLRTLPQYKYQ